MGIRTRLLWLALLATVLPALLIAGRFMQDRNREAAADTARLAVIAQRAAEQLGDLVQGSAQLLYGLARAQDLDTQDRAACSAFLSQVREVYPQYTGILTVRPDGRLFCDSLKSGRELDLSDRGYFKAAQQLQEGVALEPVFGRLTGLAVLQIAHPVRDAEGKLRFVLLASLNLQRLVDVGPLLVPQSKLLVLNHQGVVMASSLKNDPIHVAGNSARELPVFRFVQGKTQAVTDTLDSHDKLLRVWALADPALTRAASLHVLAGAPRDALLANTNRRFAQDLGLLLLSAAALLLLAATLARSAVVRPIERITEMARRLGAGQAEARIDGPLPAGELGALMAELNRTADSLQQQRNDIDNLNNRLRQSQRLEAIGQLTGGVAHDFNNLLTVVMGNAELLAEQVEGQPTQKMLAEMIVAAASRGAGLTGQLLAFARKQALEPRAVDLNPLVAQLDPMLRRTLGEHIEIELIRAAGLWPALVDPGQLENALLNLCLNARDAMPRGGRLTLETANARLDADYADAQAELKPGQYVMLAVSDTGEGIAPEHQPRVFEPFFTTKDKGKGTGLGLAMVYGFVKQSGGHVSVYSERGQGSTFKLYLPRATSAPPAVASGPNGDVDAVGGTETVLLVEDDEGVRQAAREHLIALGYAVIEAPDGPQAMRLLQQHPEVDLLFTDVVMPGGMNGRALADAARALRPGLRVLYTSGYTENAIVHHGRLDSGVLLLAKPYRRAELARAVRSALG
jgi:signal transduction histidine kinase